MRTYRVGILGFGMIGKVHAYGYINLPLYYDPPPLAAEITHVATARAETAEKARKILRAKVATTDYRQITESPDVDIVHICTPNHLHREALLSAMRHQKHIYCDKPLVATMAEAEEIRAALKDYRGTAQMTFQNRFFPATMRAKQWIDAGGLGDVLQFRVAYLHSGNVDPQAPARWKLTAAGGGGVIADIASHVLDLIEHLVGPLRSLTADTHIAYAQRPTVGDPAQRVTIDAEDCVVLLARLAGARPGTIEASKLATGSEDELRVEIHGTRGALRLNGMDPHHLEVHDATAPNQPLGGLRGWTRIDTGQHLPHGPPASGFPALKSPIGWVRGHAACLENFLAAVAEGRPAEPGLQQGLRVQYLMHCIRESAARRTWIGVD